MNDKEEAALVREIMQAPKDLTFENIDSYEDAIGKLKVKMIELVKKGAMSEQVAAKIIVESEYNFFQQIVNITYK